MIMNACFFFMFQSWIWEFQYPDCVVPAIFFVQFFSNTDRKTIETHAFVSIRIEYSTYQVVLQPSIKKEKYYETIAVSNEKDRSVCLVNNLIENSNQFSLS